MFARSGQLNRLFTVVSMVLIMLTGAVSVATAGPPRFGDHGWVAAWAASPVVGSEIPFSPDCPAGRGLHDQTVRNVVFLSTGGSAVRIRLTNTFGTTPMHIGHASVAVQAAGADAVPGTVRELTFRSHREISVPAGREVFSDPAPLRVAALSTLLVSVYVPDATGPVTNHPFTAQGNFLGAGDQALARTGASYGFTPCWMLADGVDVRPAGRVTGSVVALGDSITDTANTTGNANHRWPDFLARRLDAKPGRTLSVVNAGLGGNRVLLPRDGEPYFGVPALDRLDRDVLDQTAVRAVIVLEGVNDIGFSAGADALIAGLTELARRTHAAGLPILGATIMPFKASFVWTPEREQTWTTVNTWIRTGGAFDGVIDFAAATAAPDDPATLNPAYDSGDGLHPNDAGTRAMADAIDLRQLTTIHRAHA
jgi:lysophospholipase L1-like esterase